MHIFFNDTPLILVKPGKKIDPDNYQVHLAASDNIVPEKLIHNVLITDISAKQVEEVIKFLSDNVFHNVTSITLVVKNYENAKKFLDENMHRVKSVEEAKDKKGIVELPWCGNDHCALEIENVLDGNTLGEPIEYDGECKKYSCQVCGKPAETWMRYAKTY